LSVQDLIRFVHVRGAVRRFYFALEDDLSCGQTYFTSEGKLYSCSEVCRVLSRIFGRKRPMVGILEALAKALVYPVHLTEIVGEARILCVTWRSWMLSHLIERTA
jgi:nucleoside-diphosphate-sugar epimerase